MVVDGEGVVAPKNRRTVLPNLNERSGKKESFEGGDKDGVVKGNRVVFDLVDVFRSGVFCFS